ncbi:MAG: carbohydrate kinase [Limisphaerales bacterium]
MNPRLKTAPISVGSGLLALDLLLLGREEVTATRQYAGGSCGNVLAILAYLGWNSFPVARLGNDSRAQLVIDDLEDFHVNTSFVTKEKSGVTPVIVVRIAADKAGRLKSKFEWKDPKTGAFLPRYRPLPQKIATLVTPKLPPAKVFYFDRAEKSTLLLAKALRERGAVTFFEPTTYKDDAVFTACIAASDIVKYSVERIPTPPVNPIGDSPRLEIQTLGEKGLRYRLKIATTTPGVWKHLPPVAVDNVKDATGCGDWCSAGIIDQICSIGRDSFMSLPEKTIKNGIRFGQALASINCKYEGARGPMYHISKKKVIAEADSLLKSKVN